MLTIRECLALLPKSDRTRLILVVVAQFFMAILDLLGILLIGVVAALALSAASGLAMPPIVTEALARFGIDDSDPMRLAGIVAIFAALLLVMKTVVSAWLSRKTLIFLAHRQVTVSSALAMKLMGQSLLTVQSQSSQAHAYALTSGVNAAVSGVVGSAVIIATEAALLIVVAAGMFAIDPAVTICAALYFALLALVINRSISGWASRLGALMADSAIDSQRFAQDAFATYREISVLDRQVPVVKRFTEARRVAAASLSDTQFIGQVPKYALEVGLVVGGIGLTASQLAFRTPVAAMAVLAVFLTAATRVMPSILRLQGAALGLRTSRGAAEPTLALAAEEERAAGRRGLDTAWTAPSMASGDYAAFESRLELSHVSFTYPGQRIPALNDVSMSVPHGSSLAVVGPSGAGKSTLADLALGLIEADSGEITLSGCTPAEAIRRWPGAIAYVPQAVLLVEGTIRENIALGIPGELIDDQLVWEALDAANLRGFAESEREGLGTAVGERGSQLSGGQRQRLGIARALYSRPRFLVLDEATSALDAETEDSIARTISQLAGHVTTVVIAHRLATVRNADRVIYLEGGRLLAQGTFEEVRNSSERFALQAHLLGL
jgi:ABC-type multidrug transport system fused ATPase/permease subunit